MSPVETARPPKRVTAPPPGSRQPSRDGQASTNQAETDLASWCWPLPELHEALEVLVRRTIPPVARDRAAPPAWIGAGDESLSRWIEAAAVGIGAEAEPFDVSHADLPGVLRTAGPALLRVPGDGEPRFLAVIEGGRHRVTLLAPDLTRRHVEREALANAIRAGFEAPLRAEVDRLIAEIGIEARRHARSRAAILGERLATRWIGRVWLLRLPPGEGLMRRMLEIGAHRHLFRVIGAHLIQYLLWITSWWMMGRAALEGHLDRGWLAAWGLLLLTLVPFRLMLDWSQGLFAIGAGGLLKQRLLHGALKLDTEEIRHQGAGQLLGRVMESEAVESLALSGGVLGLMALLELVVSAVVLAFGAGGSLHSAALLAWTGVVIALGWVYYGHRRDWSESRLSLTNDLVERMAGHRTLLAQESPERWHEREDPAVERYLRVGGAMDRTAALLVALAPRGWLVLGILVLAPAFVSGRAAPLAIAIGVGGILLAHQALERLAWGLCHLAGAAIAWDQVAPLYRAAARPHLRGSPTYAAANGPSDATRAPGQSLVEASDLTFGYRTRSEPVLRGLSLRIVSGDRLLLQGPSGGGKSTLASLITGLRTPDSGLILLQGFDRHTLGVEGWRRQVAAAPQFHENHVLSETLAFNLLMGRRWPPTPEDAQEAERVCRELGLGELLDRMPGGLLQMVGDNGWQLSHGEKSRLYIARALLQGAELMLLDESFAALDPETLERAMRCVLSRAPTLVVIAHP